GNKIDIHTFNYYIDNTVNSLKAKGAIPIISSQTPDNIWSGSTLGNPPPRFVGYAQAASTQTGVTYIDHYDYVTTQYESIGEIAVNKYYLANGSHSHFADRCQRRFPGICSRDCLWKERTVSEDK
ncbi:carbohydrate esterase family 12 protein, partial [Hypholoma sublateritium FD-334 SS-4]